MIQPSISFCGAVEQRLAMFVTLMLLACGDNSSPPQDVSTWGDVANVWASAYCKFSERCYTEEYSKQFDSQDQCVAYVADLNCEALVVTCDDTYPLDNLPDLVMCVADMEALACSAKMIPASCVRAFRF